MERKLTKEQFEQSYIKNNGLTQEEYEKFNVTMECDCDYENCKGWAAVSNNPLAIESQIRLYQNKF